MTGTLSPCFRFCIILCSLAALAWPTPYAQAAPAASTGANVNGWFLSQRAREEGNIDVELCKTGVRMTVSKSGLVILAAAPWRDAYMYCLKTHNIFKMPLEKYANPYMRTMVMFDGGALAETETVERGKETSVGIECKLLTEKPGFAKRQLEKRRQGQIAPRSPMTIQYLVTDHFKVDPRISHIMAKVYAVPVTDSVPLQFNYTNVSREKDKQLSTTAVKPAKFKASDFQPPAGLKTVKDGMAVLVPEDSDPGLDLMMMGRTKLK